MKESYYVRLHKLHKLELQLHCISFALQQSFMIAPVIIALHLVRFRLRPVMIAFNNFALQDDGATVQAATIAI